MQTWSGLLAAGVAGSHMAGHIVLSGRAKDTIVLSSGENVEPAPIEDALAASPYIQHVVLLGQDARMLGALVSPCAEAFQELEAVRGGAPISPAPPTHPLASILLSCSSPAWSLHHVPEPTGLYAAQ